MEYIKPKDYEYIMRKYHDPKIVNGNRMIRKDDIFDPSTGMDGDLIRSEILRRDKEFEHLLHPVRKAKAFEFVLKNTRISCTPLDLFPAINSIDRPVNGTLTDLWSSEVFTEIIPEVAKKRAYYEDAGIVTMWPDYDHSVPVWDRIFELGFSGLLNESEKARKKRPLTDDEDAFFEGIKITYTAIIDLVLRLAELAKNTSGSEKLAKKLLQALK